MTVQHYLIIWTIQSDPILVVPQSSCCDVIFAQRSGSFPLEIDPLFVPFLKFSLLQVVFAPEESVSRVERSAVCEVARSSIFSPPAFSDPHHSLPEVSCLSPWLHIRISQNSSWFNFSLIRAPEIEVKRSSEEETSDWETNLSCLFYIPALHILNDLYWSIWNFAQIIIKFQCWTCRYRCHLQEILQKHRDG